MGKIPLGDLADDIANVGSGDHHPRHLRLQPVLPVLRLTNAISLDHPGNAFVFDISGPFGGYFALSAAINLLTVVFLVFFIFWFNRWSKAAEGVTYA